MSPAQSPSKSSQPEGHAVSRMLNLRVISQAASSSAHAAMNKAADVEAPSEALEQKVEEQAEDKFLVKLDLTNF